LSTAAAVLNRHTGDEITLEGHKFRIAGVYESTALIENGAVILTLTEAQAVTDKPGKVNVLNLKLDEASSPADVDTLRTLVRERLPGYTAITSAELVRGNAIVRISKAMSGATILIAGLVSALVVFNTMLMSITERTREIGVLLALGWSRRGVLRLVCAESALLAFCGGVLGVFLGVGMTAILGQLELMRGKIEPVFSTPFLGLVMVLAVGLGILGGLYPALKAARLQPAQALRYE
jgi:putative ABC transport system permease protein